MSPETVGVTTLDPDDIGSILKRWRIDAEPDERLMRRDKEIKNDKRRRFTRNMMININRRMHQPSPLCILESGLDGMSTHACNWLSLVSFLFCAIGSDGNGLQFGGDVPGCKYGDQTNGHNEARGGDE